MEELTKLVSNINSFIWGMYCLIPLLCGVGIYFTIRLKFIQVRKFGQAVRMLFGDLSLKGKRADKHGMSSFQSVATAIAAQVGTGNLAGAATALNLWDILQERLSARLPYPIGSLLFLLIGTGGVFFASLLACILLRSVKKRVLLIMERLPHRGQP